MSEEELLAELRDRWKASLRMGGEIRRLQGVLTNRDHNIAHQARRIRELTKERDEARAEADDLADENHIVRKALRHAELHRDELRADLDRARIELTEVYGTRETGSSIDFVPRAITSDELREGQIVKVRLADGEWRTLRVENVGMLRVALNQVHILLLEDALAPDSELNPEPQGLTVGELNTAPAGARIEDATGRAYLVKDGNGSWLGIPPETIASWKGWQFSAPAPDPEPEPWKPSAGDVGIVTHLQGEELDASVVAIWDYDGWWRRADGERWPGEASIALPHEVTVVRAKVVPNE